MSNLHRIQWIDSRIRENRFPNCTTIAEEFCISVRQASRDVEYLKYSLGAPIEYSESGKGYYYTEETFVLPSVLMTEDEKKAILYLAERYRKAGSEMTLRLAALFDKLGGKELDTAAQNTSIPVYKVRKKDISASKMIEEAVRLKRKIRIDYIDSANRKTGRTIRPYAFFARGVSEYVVGFCELRNAERSFKIEKIRSVAFIDETFSLPHGFDPEKYGARPIDFRIPYAAIVRFEGAVNEARPDWEKQAGDNTFSIRFKSSADLFGMLTSLGTGFTIIAPSWLRKKCASFFRSLYEKNS
jgi:predicted DNA-binding transcriptional regulator YafY